VTLEPGTYVIGGQSFAGQGSFAYDSTIATAPEVTWIEGRADWGSALSFPDAIVRPQPTSYFGPNFMFAASSLIPVNGYLYDGTGAGRSRQLSRTAVASSATACSRPRQTSMTASGSAFGTISRTTARPTRK